MEHQRADTAWLNYGITAIPGGSDGAYSPEGGCSYMLTKGADEQTKEAVYKFMAYWLSDDVLKEWSNRNGFPGMFYSVLRMRTFRTTSS